MPEILAITPAQGDFASILAYAITIPGTVLCFLVLVVYGVAACIPASRRHLDRVSLRLLTYAMAFNVLYGIAFSVTASQTGPGPLCTFGAFAVNFTLFFSALFTFSIALNLQLVLVHNFNGKVMEKYYVICTTLLSIIFTVPAYAMGQFGWNETNSTCWFKSANDAVRLRWLLGTQSFWILFIATGETICSCVVLVYMSRYQRISQRLRNPSRSTRTKTSISGTSTLEQVSKHRKIILRIALYPLISMAVNYSTSILDIYQTVRGLHTDLDFRLLVLDLCLYGFRTAAYALLAMFDPSFIRAVRANSHKANSDQSTAIHTSTSPSRPHFIGSSTATTSGQLTVNIELERVTQTGDDAIIDKPHRLLEFYKPEDKFDSGSDLVQQGRANMLTSTSTPTDITNDESWRTEVEKDMDLEFQSQL